MTRLVWDAVEARFYETGVDRGVLYPKSGPGVPWNGLTAVDENVSGGDAEPLYFDGVKYLDIVGAEDFQATITALSAPAEFAACDGSRALAYGLFATQQPRASFNFSYRTLIGSYLDGNDRGYKLHLVYHATASPSSRNNESVNETPAPSSLSWEVNTVPAPATTYKPTAHLIVDSTLSNAASLASLENILYGSASLTPAFPTQAAVIALMNVAP